MSLIRKCLHSCLSCHKVFSIQGDPLQKHYDKCFMTDEEWRVFDYVRTKKRNCRRKGIDWMLTEGDIRQLLDQAGIEIYDVGRGAHKYQLGRKGDTGPYEIGNCRFITQRENLSEQWTDEFRQMRSRQVTEQNRQRKR